MIAEALYPYPEDLVIATKGGLTRTGPAVGAGRPARIPARQACEISLRRLGWSASTCCQLHRDRPQVPAGREARGAQGAAGRRARSATSGLSECSVEQLEAARGDRPIVSVQNRYNLTDRAVRGRARRCERESIGFIPWFPLATGELARPGGRLDRRPPRHGATPAQVALAWLLHRSPVMLPIPGTSSVEHLEENIAGASLTIDKEQLAAL